MEFRGQYNFLSNMHFSPIIIKIGDIEYTFSCAEAAFQAHKDPLRAGEFVGLTGPEARKLGRTVTLRTDWENIKLAIMENVQFEKYKQHPELREKLIAIDGEIVEDGKYANNEFWGVSNKTGEGENHLGRIIMKVRAHADPFYCLVAGSRNYDDYDEMCTVLDKLLSKQEYVVIVEGGAKGADLLARRYAQEHHYAFEEYQVTKGDWNKYGKVAGYNRNRTMHVRISSHKHRGAVMFWSTKEQSRGTKQNFALADSFDNPLRVFDYYNHRMLSKKELDFYRMDEKTSAAYNNNQNQVAQQEENSRE